MSERTFRAVVALVLVAALALAAIVVQVALDRTASRSPTGSPQASGIMTRAPSTTASPFAGPAFGVPSVVGVGPFRRGFTSTATLSLRFLESANNAIPNAMGSFELTLTDHAGTGSTVEFVGTPLVTAPGSLGAQASVTAPNVLTVTIVASDSFNVELMTISGLKIRASATAAIGSLQAQLGAFDGSLARGVAGSAIASPGEVTAP